MNFFNPELQLKNTESPIRNKLKDLLAELRGFKFHTTFVIEFQKIVPFLMVQQNIALFFPTQKQEQLLIKVILMMYLNQFILKLYNI